MQLIFVGIVLNESRVQLAIAFIKTFELLTDPIN